MTICAINDSVLIGCSSVISEVACICTSVIGCCVLVTAVAAVSVAGRVVEWSIPMMRDASTSEMKSTNRRAAFSCPWMSASTSSSSGKVAFFTAVCMSVSGAVCFFRIIDSAILWPSASISVSRT